MHRRAAGPASHPTSGRPDALPHHRAAGPNNGYVHNSTNRNATVTCVGIACVCLVLFVAAGSGSGGNTAVTPATDAPTPVDDSSWSLNGARAAVNAKAQQLRAAQDEMRKVSADFIRARAKAAAEAHASVKGLPPKKTQAADPVAARDNHDETASAGDVPPPPTALPSLPERILEASASTPVSLTLACHSRRVPSPEAPRAYVDTKGHLVIPEAPTHPAALAHVTSPLYATADDAAAIAQIGALGERGALTGAACADAILEEAIAAGPAHAVALAESHSSIFQIPRSGWSSAFDAFNQSDSAFAHLVQFRDIQHRPGVRPLVSKDQVFSAETVAKCVDPRFPTRTPLMLLPFGEKAHDGNPSSVLPCYGSGDLVCDTLRVHGVWEPDVIALVHQALAGVAEERSRRLWEYLRALADAAAAAPADRGGPKTEAAGLAAIAAAMRTFAAGDESSGNRFGPAASFDVEYLDIGANVGAFLLHFWRNGYPVTAFEALPFNMQLLSTSMCLNGMRKPAGDFPSDASEAAGSAHGPAVRVFHTALGRERDVRCVMMSEDLNFGDTFISCNATHVGHTSSEFPFDNYRRRGYVNMTTLDSFVVGKNSRIPPSQHKAAARDAAVTAGLASIGIDVTDEAAMKKLAEVEQANLKPEQRLPEDFLAKDYVVKIDVEGHEVSVMQGATAFLADPMLRPRLIVSEVWLKLNMTEYALLMFPNGYIGWSVAFRLRMASMHSVRQYNRMRAGQDTVIWVEKRWEGILIPRLITPRVKRPASPPGAGAAGSGLLAPPDRKQRRHPDTAPGLRPRV